MHGHGHALRRGHPPAPLPTIDILNKHVTQLFDEWQNSEGKKSPDSTRGRTCLSVLPLSQARREVSLKAHMHTAQQRIYSLGHLCLVERAHHGFRTASHPHMSSRESRGYEFCSSASHDLASYPGTSQDQPLLHAELQHYIDSAVRLATAAPAEDAGQSRAGKGCSGLDGRAVAKG